MSARNAWIVVLSMVMLGALVVAQSLHLRLPGNHHGYEPEQPIAFSHRLHAGELGIECRYCHSGAWKSRSAGVPAASLCMNCHQEVTAGLDVLRSERELALAEGREPRRIVSSELRKLYDAQGLDEDLEPARPPRPIPWVRVHDMPDFVYFDHRVHVARGMACQTCHGPVESMERVRQDSSLSMSWCLSCHRDNPAVPGGPLHEHVTTDCAACHF